MRTWARRTLIASAALVAIVAFAYYWLIVESHVPADLSYEIDLDEIRRLANEPAGDKPTAIEVEEIAAFDFYATAIVAGDGWGKRRLPVYSYRIVSPASSIIVDTAFSRDSEVPNLASFDPAAFARMARAMSRASRIVVTHEHFDHIGGLTVHPPSILKAARLTRQQIADPGRSLPARFERGAFDGYEPLRYERYYALAPGVVLIEAPGHTPGSQMVYVRTADGKEVLFIGDVAWQSRNIELQRERARLVTWLFLKEDRHAVFGELAELKRLTEQEPTVHIVPGHDGDRVAALISGGVLKPQFAEATPSS
jgi:glyoxylase-like metal-dependent hydrolase (beta-lactamase superfamily II)